MAEGWDSNPRALCVPIFFYGLFYGRTKFCCKTAQLSGTQRECGMAETPSDSVAVQRSENLRKKSFLNYESPALTAELQARDVSKLNHANR